MGDSVIILQTITHITIYRTLITYKYRDLVDLDMNLL